METKEGVIDRLHTTLESLKYHNALDKEGASSLVSFIYTINDCCDRLKAAANTRDQEQMLNYCKAKLEHASQLILSDNLEESCVLTRSTIMYLLKIAGEEAALD